MEKFNAILLQNQSYSYEYPIIEDLLEIFQLEFHANTDYSMYEVSAEDSTELIQHFPRLSSVVFIPNLRNELQIFQSVISDLKTEMFPDQANKRDSTLVNEIMNFTMIYWMS